MASSDFGVTAPAELSVVRDDVGLIPHPRLSTGRSGDAGALRLRDAHVLVVGINYAPEPTGIAPYTTGIAEHLSSRTRSVTVLTGVPHYPSWRVPSPYRWMLRCSEQSRMDNSAGLTVRRLRHLVPRRQTALRRAAYEFSFLANAWSVRVRYAPDVVIAVTPSLGGAVAGARMAQRYGAKLLVVVQDLMAKAATQSGISGGRRVAASTALLERYALSRADRVAIVSESFRAPVRAYGVPDGRVTLLPNWTHIEPVTLTREQARRELGWPVEPFTVVHTGNIGLKQDLANVVEAARLMRGEPGFRFVIVGDGSQREQVRAVAEGLPNVAFVDPLGEAAYPKALAAADVLVLNERPGVHEMSLPSKLTSYLSASRPVLAAVAADGAAARELAATGGAAALVAPGDPAGMAACVRELHANTTQCARMATAGKRYADAALGRDAAGRRMDAVVQELLQAHDSTRTLQLDLAPEPS